MNKAFVTILLCCLSFASSGSESARGLRHVSVDVFDTESVRRGAGYFAQYCQGCHGIKQIRYSRIGRDVEIDESTMRQEFLFGGAKIHDAVRTALAPSDAETVFGIVPPDLSLVVRARGADWVYSYLNGFYADPKRPFGVNNLIAANVAMPNVLWEWQGVQEPVISHAKSTPEIVDVRVVESGRMSVHEFDRMLKDIVNFLAYVAEPSQLERLPLGKYVLAFLFLLTVILFKLKKEYWKDIEQNSTPS